LWAGLAELAELADYLAFHSKQKWNSAVSGHATVSNFLSLVGCGAWRKQKPMSCPSIGCLSNPHSQKRQFLQDLLSGRISLI
jgi:hypothetical protein